jgi:hypothetical protein
VLRFIGGRKGEGEGEFLVRTEVAVERVVGPSSHFLFQDGPMIFPASMLVHWSAK